MQKWKSPFQDERVMQFSDNVKYYFQTFFSELFNI